MFLSFMPARWAGDAVALPLMPTTATAATTSATSDFLMLVPFLLMDRCGYAAWSMTRRLLPPGCSRSSASSRACSSRPSSTAPQNRSADRGGDENGDERPDDEQSEL